MAQAARAGAMIVKPAQETFCGGYAGYFQDPNVHIWEGVWNPDNLAIDSPGSPSACGYAEVTAGDPQSGLWNEARYCVGLTPSRSRNAALKAETEL
jgi:hypothetical protein